MKVLVLSDLHIGNEYSLWKWNDEEFINKISDTISKYEIDAVVLNGDIYELYKYSMHDIIQEHIELIKFIDQFKIITGNHDLIYGQEEFDIKNSKGQIIHFEHGHNSDWLNGTYLGRFISKSLVRQIRRLSRFELIKKIYLFFVELDAESIPKKYNSLIYLNYALKLLHKYDVVFLGHTHRMELVTTFYNDKKKMYLNSGTCINKKFQCIIFDTETFEVITIKENNNV